MLLDFLSVSDHFRMLKSYLLCDVNGGVLTIIVMSLVTKTVPEAATGGVL